MRSTWGWVFGAALIAALLCPGLVQARNTGLAVQDCTGCHGGSGQRPATVSISADPMLPQPGQTVRLTVSIATGNAAGLFFRSVDDVGTLAPVTGQSTKLVEGGLVQSTPKAAVNGTTTFAIDWTAPASPGDVQLFAYALAVNRDGTSTGDSFGTAYLSLTFGCTGTPYYPDYDADGYGAVTTTPRLACSAPDKYSARTGDCDDYDAKRNPATPEQCNGLDDNCNGMIDEDVVYATYCEDKDGDGHGIRGAPTKEDCTSRDGFGLCDGDCNDSDPNVYPGAAEACNYRDDNCNNRIDEGARMTCGVGWCQRASESCTVNLCTPGDPIAETCNALDDDCDGTVDDGDLCSAGQQCVNGACVGAGAVVDAGTADAAARDAGARDAAMSSSSSSAGCALTHAHGGSMLLALALWLRRRRPRSG